MTALLGLKIVLLTFLLKMAVKAALPISYSTWAVSYAVVVSSCFWDTLVCRVILEQVGLIGVGIAAGPELFNEIVREGAPTRHEAEIVCVRAIAVAIGAHGRMMPTMELLLRHAIQYFKLEGSADIETPRTPLDSVPCFLKDLKTLKEDEADMVKCILLLTQILDGSLGANQLVIWSRLYQHLGTPYPPDENGLQGCAQRFRNYIHTGKGLQVEVLKNALDDEDSNDDSHTLGCSDTLFFRLRKLLLK